MDRKEALQKVRDVFVDALDNEDIVLTEESSAKDVEDWDSLTHIQLVVGVEKTFKIRFTAKEIQSWKNVGEMLDSISGKVA